MMPAGTSASYSAMFSFLSCSVPVKSAATEDVDVRDVIEEDGLTIVYAEPDQFAQVQDALRQSGVEDFKIAEFEMLPQTDIELSADDQATLEKLIDALEDLEDVQNVFHNVDLK